jgi:stalled ribosome alternative rescue factor ArfA
MQSWINENRQDCYRRKIEPNRHVGCSPKRKFMKSVLGVNISLSNPSDTLPNRQGFKIVSCDCHETPEFIIRISEAAPAVIWVNCFCNMYRALMFRQRHESECARIARGTYRQKGRKMCGKSWDNLPVLFRTQIYFPSRCNSIHILPVFNGMDKYFKA